MPPASDPISEPPLISFRDRVRSALIWRSGSQIVAQCITWGSTLAVFRLLDPADYGIFAMTQVVLAFLSFLNGYGFAAALVQTAELNPRRVRQAFGLLLLLNAGLAALQFAAAPLAAAYFRQPLVADLLRVQALIFLAIPFIALPEVMMSRTLDFRRQALVNLAAALIGATTALVCATSGLGVWTLVFAPIAGFWARAIGLTIAARLLVWPSFDFRGCAQIIGFGGALLASHFFWLVQTQADIMIGARQFTPYEIGLYAEGLFLAQIFVAKFVPPLNEVAFPAFSRLQDDPDGVRWSFQKAVRLIMLVAAPVYAGIAVTAAPLVETLLSAKWLDMVPYIQLLAIAMPFMTVQVLFAPVMNAMGRPWLTARTSLAGAVLFPAGFMVGAQFGLIGMAAAWLVSAPLLLALTAWVARPIVGVRLTEVARAVTPGVSCAAGMAALVLALDAWSGIAAAPAPLRLAGLAAVGAVSYALLLWLVQRPAVDELLRLARRDAVPQADPKPIQPEI